MPPTTRVLHGLFLRLFIRGRSIRSARADGAPESMGRKLVIVLISYILVGSTAIAFVNRSAFALSVYLHAMTFGFLGMIVVAAASETLFNQDEFDILMHRPVTARDVLRAKIGLLARLALWIAAAFNVVGAFVGVATSDGGWLFPLAHALSSTMQALFCTAGVVLSYQLCLRWLGRSRLEGLLSGAQVVLAMGIVLGSQLVPRLLAGRLDGALNSALDTWWSMLLPPVWFAAIDDVIVRGLGSTSVLAAVAVVATATALWLSLSLLIREADQGWHPITEAGTARTGYSGAWFLRLLVERTPLRWWLREPAARVGFILTAVYLLRDRDVRLRVYPALAPVLGMPFLVLTSGRPGASFSNGWLTTFAGGFIGMIPMLTLNLLRYSQQWAASESFRSAPMTGPAPLWRGARAAVFLILTLPAIIVSMMVIRTRLPNSSLLLLQLPQLLLLPIYSLVPGVAANDAPLAVAAEGTTDIRRGLTLMFVTLFGALLSAATTYVAGTGWFWHLVATEAVIVVILHRILTYALSRKHWPKVD